MIFKLLFHHIPTFIVDQPNLQKTSKNICSRHGEVNLDMFKVTKAKWIFFITYNYLSLLLIIFLIYFIVFALYYFKIHLRLI